MKHILSLGAGVQSSTMALMAARGEITPMPDAAIFADTQAEPGKVYAWYEYLTPHLPFPCYLVTKGNLATDSLQLRRSKKSGKVYMKHQMPLFLRKPDGSQGLLQRRCTEDYKIVQIVRRERDLAGGSGAIRLWRRAGSQRVVRQVRRRGKLVTLAQWERRPEADPLLISWIGISTDEADRMKPSKEDWIGTRWPLIDLGMTRGDCHRWMADRGYPDPPRSACYFCPYHSDAEWVRLRTEEPEEFEKAAAWEEACQALHSRQEVLHGVPFLHRSMIPLREVAFDVTDTRRGFGNECAGICGV